MIFEFGEQSEQRIHRNRSKLDKRFHQIVRDVVRIPPNQIQKKREGFGRSEVPEDVDQFQIEIDWVVIMALGGKAHQVRERVLWMVNQRVQQTMIYRNIALRCGFEKSVGRNAFIAPRLQNKIGSRQTLLLFLDHPHRDFSRNIAVKPQRDLVLA